MTLKQLRKLADVKNAKVATQRFNDGWGYWLLNKDGTDIYPDGNYHADRDSLGAAINQI